VTTITSTTATDRCFLKSSTKAKTKSRLRYAYVSLGDYRFIAAHFERKRPAVGEPVFVTGDRADTRMGRAL
jgi:hypothetical protein